MEKKFESLKSRMAKLDLSKVGRSMNRGFSEVKTSIQEEYRAFTEPEQPSQQLRHPPPRPPPPQIPPRPNSQPLAFTTTRTTNSISPVVPSRPLSEIQTTKSNNFIPSDDRSNNRWTLNIPLENNCIMCRDFNAADKQASKYPRQYVSSIKDLAHDLCSPFASKTDKARVIFTWLHHNIVYDTMAFFGNNVRHKEPEDTMLTGLAVCQGYAELFAILGLYANLEVLVVSGYGKGFGHREITNGVVPSFTTNHAWNAFKMDNGQWQLIDCCWGAGYLDETRNYVKRFASNQFTSSPESFRLKHFPSNSTQQFCRIEMSWKEYIMMKEGPLIYTGFTDKGFCEETVEPSLRAISPQPTKFVITSKCAHTFIPPKDQYVLLLNVDGAQTPFHVDPMGTTWTCETWAIRHKSVVCVNYLTQLGGRDGKGVTVAEYVHSIGRVSMSWNGLCRWDVK